MATNIGYWEQVLQSPTPAYQALFEAEQQYLLDNIQPDSKVLDIGCGEGRNMATILKRTEFVFGIDNDQVAVDDALKNFQGLDNVKVLKAEAVDLPFEDELFDTITFLMILPNLENTKQEAFNESARVLKNGGMFILSTFSETAFEERMNIYKQVGVGIEKIEGTKIIFAKELGANTSEQFSLEELENFANAAGLEMKDNIKVGELAYICKFIKS